MGGGSKTRMSSGRNERYKYMSMDTCIIMSWLVNRGDLWEMVPKLVYLKMRRWSQKWKFEPGGVRGVSNWLRVTLD